MFQVEYDPEDLAQLNISLNGLMPPELVGDELKPLGVNIVFDTQRYPPPIPDSTYVRTNKLFEGWHNKKLSPLSLRIWNPVDYGIYVQGREQAPVHQGRWKVLFEEAQKHVEALLDKLARKVDKIWTT